MKCFICSSLKDRYKFSVNFIKKGQKVILTIFSSWQTAQSISIIFKTYRAVTKIGTCKSFFLITTHLLGQYQRSTAPLLYMFPWGLPRFLLSLQLTYLGCPY